MNDGREKKLIFIIRSAQLKEVMFFIKFFFLPFYFSFFSLITYNITDNTNVLIRFNNDDDDGGWILKSASFITFNIINNNQLNTLKFSCPKIYEMFPIKSRASIQ